MFVYVHILFNVSNTLWVWTLSHCGWIAYTMYTVMYYNGIRLVSRIIHLWYLGCPHTYTHAHTAQNFIMIKLKTWKCSYIQNLYDYGSNTKGEKPTMTMSVVTNSKINSLQNQVKWLQLLIYDSLLWTIASFDQYINYLTVKVFLKMTTTDPIHYYWIIRDDLVHYH